eukprot:m51a1_g14261 hypothetical protein (384) ;mRNA; f:297541-299004
MPLYTKANSNRDTSHIMRALLALLVLAAAASANYNYIGNVTIKGGAKWSADLDFRLNGHFSVSVKNYFIGGLFLSVNASGDGKASGSSTWQFGGHADSIWSFGGVTTQTYPMTFYGTFDGSADIGVSNTASWKLDDLKVNGALGFIAAVYPSLHEIDANGKQVKEISLRWADGFNWVEQERGSLNGLTWLRIKGTPKNSQMTISYTFFSTEKAGTIDYGKTAVAPKLFNTIIDINGYEYANTANHLELRVIGASAGATGEVNGMSTAGKKPVWAVFLPTAQNNGKDVDAGITGWASVDAAAGVPTALGTIIGRASGNAQWTCQGTYIKLPAGAKSITYNAVLGQGISNDKIEAQVASDDFNPTGSASSVAAGFLAVAAASMFF